MDSVTLPALELRQGKTTLLLTKMKAGDLAKYSHICSFDHELAADDKNQGYQRPPDESRIKRFGNWVRGEINLGNEVRMPTAILLSDRGSKVTLSTQNMITLSSDNKLPLVDGQHRQAGLLYAIDQKKLSEVGDYDIPVVIMQGLNKIEEMIQFRIVNSTQKSVRTDLVNMLLAQIQAAQGEESIKESDRWKVVASNVVRRLTEEEGGPWHDKILMPDQKQYSKAEINANPDLQHKRTSRATSWFTSIQGLVKFNLSRNEQGVAEEETYRALDSYWRAIQERMPECFAQAGSYVLQKTPGIFSLNLFLLSLTETVRGELGLDPLEILEGQLDRSTLLNRPSFWALKTETSEAGGATMYGSMKGFKQLFEVIKDDREDSSDRMAG